MTATIGDLKDCPGALTYVIENMREWDRREIFAMRSDDDLQRLAVECCMAGPLAWIAGAENPVAAFGARELWPGVWTMWFFATNEVDKIGFSVTKFIRRAIDVAFAEGYCHRLECRSMEGHEDAHRWLSTLGAVREGTLLDYGRGRETFHVYVWRR